MLRRIILVSGLFILYQQLQAQGDPFPNTEVQNQVPDPPKKTETSQQKKPYKSPAQYQFKRLGAYNWRPGQVSVDPNVKVDRRGIPTIYYAGGRDFLDIITFNVELLFNWSQFNIRTQTSQARTFTQSDYYSAGLGAQMEIKLPFLPLENIVPYGQGSVGAMYQWINTGLEDPAFTYNITIPGFYYTVGGGAIFYLSETIGLFAEAGSFWYRSKDSQADIFNDILEKQGITGVNSAAHGASHEPLKSRSNYLKLGIIFRTSLR